MPEGPEIRIAADQVEKAIIYDPLEEAWFAFAHLKPYEAKLRNSRVLRIETRGKAMLTRFDNGLVLYTHNQLYGKWFVNKPGALPKTNRQLRIRLGTRHKTALLYSASDIEVLDDKSVNGHPFLRRIGPDILNPDLIEQTVVERLGYKRFKRRSLGALYLDQAFLAGLGNYLRTEILFTAKLRAEQRPIELNERAIESLAKATLAISRRSYSSKGITVSPSLVKALKNAGETRSQYRFWAFSRAGQACRVCDHPIKKVTHGGRNWFYCDSCQPPSI